jgi:hypothetical protein
MLSRHTEPHTGSCAFQVVHGVIQVGNRPTIPPVSGWATFAQSEQQRLFSAGFSEPNPFSVNNLIRQGGPHYCDLSVTSADVRLSVAETLLVPCQTRNCKRW